MYVYIYIYVYVCIRMFLCIRMYVCMCECEGTVRCSWSKSGPVEFKFEKSSASSASSMILPVWSRLGLPALPSPKTDPPTDFL